MNILWWIAGADADLLEQSHASDRMKYSAIGMSILLTTFAGILSGGYAFYTIFKNPIISLILGMFWGFFIFNIDRLIVLTIHKEKKVNWPQIGMGLLRFFVAVLIAVVVAKPLELRIFEQNILAEIAQENARVAVETQKTLNEGMPEIRQLEAQNQALEKIISEKEKNRNQWCGKAIEEAEGTSGTGKEGKGPVYAEKQAMCQQQEQELQALQAKNQPILDENRQRLRQLQDKKDEQFQTIKTAQEKADDIISQLNTLERLGQKNPAIAHASRAISWLFIVIDTAPIFAKLLSKRSAYDALLERREHELIENAEQEIAYISEIVRRQKRFELEQYQQAIEEASTSNRMSEVLQEVAAEIINHTKQQLLKLVSKYRLPRSIKTAIKKEQKSTAEKIYIAQKQERETQRKVNQFVAEANQKLRNFVNSFF